MFGIDLIYIVLIGVCFLLSMGASLLVKNRFAAAARVPSSRGLSGAECAAAIVRATGLDRVTIVEHQGFLSDHYNPMTRTLALSPEVYHGRNAAALGVAAHEAGHAIQHAHAYAPMWARSVLVPVANIGSMIGPWIIMGGIALGAANAVPGIGHTVALVGVALFGAATLFTLVTVPVEFNASNRARVLLDDLGLVRNADERAAVRGVLTAAGLTYVAAAVGSVTMLLYWAWRAGLLGGSQNRN